MKKLIIAVATAALLSACASGPKHTKNDAAGAIAAAQHENKRAAKKNFVWRDAGKIIKKAKKAMKAGDFDKAVKLANKAKRQGTLALQQEKEQRNAGPRF